MADVATDPARSILPNTNTVVLTTRGKIAAPASGLAGWLNEIEKEVDLGAVLARKWRLPDSAPWLEKPEGTIQLEPSGETQGVGFLRLTWQRFEELIFVHLVGHEGPETPELLVKLMVNRIRQMSEGQDKAMQHLLYSAQIDGRAAASAGILHDFNNQLTGLCTLSEMAAADAPEDESLQMMADAAKQGQALITRIVRLHREHLGSPELLDLSDLVEHAKILVEGILLRGSKLNLQTPTDALPVRVVRSDWEAVLIELARNAQAAGQGQRIILEIEISRQGEEALLVVSDNAGGMDPETRNEATEPFFSTAQDRPGLGLAMVKHVVACSGGHLQVNPRENPLGVQVEIRLPLARFD